jgi:hypothetical protein
MCMCMCICMYMSSIVLGAPMDLLPRYFDIRFACREKNHVFVDVDVGHKLQ